MGEATIRTRAGDAVRREGRPGGKEHLKCETGGAAHIADADITAQITLRAIFVRAAASDGMQAHRSSQRKHVDLAGLTGRYIRRRGTLCRMAGRPAARRAGLANS
jgi:hypothetical protein